MIIIRTTRTYLFGPQDRKQQYIEDHCQNRHPQELQGIFQDWEEQEQYQGEDQQDIGDNQEQIYWFPEV